MVPGWQLSDFQSQHSSLQQTEVFPPPAVTASPSSTPHPHPTPPLRTYNHPLILHVCRVATVDSWCNGILSDESHGGQHLPYRILMSQPVPSCYAVLVYTLIPWCAHLGFSSLGQLLIMPVWGTERWFRGEGYLLQRLATWAVSDLNTLCLVCASLCEWAHVCVRAHTDTM